MATKKKEQFYYPDLNQAFIGVRNALELNASYIKMLEATSIYHNSQCAAKLHEFANIDKKKGAIRKSYKAIKVFLRNWSKKYGIRVIFKVRKKDWIGYVAKIMLYQKNDRNLSKIRDLLGFKLILETEYPDTKKNHQLCYQLANDLLDFLTTTQHCLLLEAEPKSGKSLDLSKKPPHVFIYEKDELKAEYTKNVKNYLIQPKEDFYQGLHTFVQTPDDVTLEIQIHTVATNIQAQKLHQKYKYLRYKDIRDQIHINYQDINIPGLVFDEDGTAIFDSQGIFLSNFNFIDED